MTPETPSSSYDHPARLAEVLALLQVLAYSRTAVRAEGGLRTTLGREPSSAESWHALADEHPELFRVTGGKDPQVSLIARWALAPAGEKSQRPVLGDETTDRLAHMAMRMHDAAQARRDRVIEDLRRSEERLSEGGERRKERERQHAERLAEERKLRETTRATMITAAGAVIVAALAVASLLIVKL